MIELDSTRADCIKALYDRMQELSEEEDADNALLEERSQDRAAIVLEYELPPEGDDL